MPMACSSSAVPKHLMCDFSVTQLPLSPAISCRILRHANDCWRGFACMKPQLLKVVHPRTTLSCLRLGQPRAGPFLMVAEMFKKSPQQISPNQRHPDKQQSNRQMHIQGGHDPKPWEYYNLGDDREQIANKNIRGGLQQRHELRLFHAASRSFCNALKALPSPSSTACCPVNCCHRSTATST